LGVPGSFLNAHLPVAAVEDATRPDAAGRKLLVEAADALRLSARGYHRVLKVARTIADLDGVEAVGRIHLAEALAYRASPEPQARAA
ncbi:ATP-binding protein, partial [Hansschlegelia beijingensis]